MQKTVIVVGSINVDLVVKVGRLPRSGETVIGGAFARVHGGKGGNQASAARALGARTRMIAMVGDDDLGRDALSDLQGRGIDVSGIGTVDTPTGVAAIVVDEEGENLIAVASGANAELSPDRVNAALIAAEDAQAVMLTNLEISLDAVDAAAKFASERAWSSVLNLAPSRDLPIDMLSRFDVVIANQYEIEAPVGIGRLLEAGVDCVIVTRGVSGADLYRPDRGALHQDAFRVDSVDTTGAGDAFCGAFCSALSERLPLEGALQTAAAAGALATRAVGARGSLADANEVAAMIAKANTDQR